MKRSIIVAVAVAVAAALVSAGTASATHRDGDDNASCVAQFVVPGAHAGRYGEVVSGFAHASNEFGEPLGRAVSAQARSPREACLIPPPE